MVPNSLSAAMIRVPAPVGPVDGDADSLDRCEVGGVDAAEPPPPDVAGESSDAQPTANAHTSTTSSLMSTILQRAGNERAGPLELRIVDELWIDCHRLLGRHPLQSSVNRPRTRDRGRFLNFPSTAG